MFWAYLFRDLLFEGVGARWHRDRETGAPVPPDDYDFKLARSNAVFFNVGSGDSQRRLLESVAEVVLSDRAELLRQVKDLLKTSRVLALKRNQIVHAYYDNPFIWDGRGLRFEPYAVQDLGGARKKPDFDFAQAITDFRRHGNEIRDVWLEWVVDR